MTSRTARMERKLKNRACPRCHKPRLIQKEPRNYRKIRCQECGGIFAFSKESTNAGA